jgi:hypothetical protein
MKYTIIKTESGEILQRVDEDGKVWFIPMDAANSDYRAYLADEATAK